MTMFRSVNFFLFDSPVDPLVANAIWCATAISSPSPFQLHLFSSKDSSLPEFRAVMDKLGGDQQSSWVQGKTERSVESRKTTAEPSQEAGVSNTIGPVLAQAPPPC